LTQSVPAAKANVAREETEFSWARSYDVYG